MSEASKKCRRKRKQDMNWMKRHLIFINMVWASMLLLGSCTSESGTGIPDVTPVVPSKPTNNTETAVSQDEITFQVTGKWEEAANTRMADLYENMDELQEEVKAISGTASKFFHIDAYYDGRTDKYIDNSHVFYFPEAATKWNFATGTTIQHYYWPPSQTDTYLNFFAYAPEVLTYTGVTIGTYIDRTPVINCDLKTDNNQVYTEDANEIPMKEFMYAFAAGQNKTEHAASGVTLNFMHPFAAIYIELGSAKQLMKLNSVTLKRIYKKGTGTYNSSGPAPTTNWVTDTTDPDGTPDMTMTINKVMGTTMQKGDVFGPLIVMPQDLHGRADKEDIKMVVTYTPNGDPLPTIISEIVIYDSSTHTSWAPGKKYIYTLDLGEDDGAVNISVAVTDWDDKGSETSVDVD